ncbi:aspartate aminotransferase family protein [Agromyces seonyuensis]|uniref:Aminotransferase class III-fold pyridoxal phosphate-dependent enzyme n=1 Tax=Agromyces seonyuensis TaxID=2662446 RepID=A0A6I4NRQ0_9MICO|nr:aspartate aminotransferase family protein [Agromyces seonyuensis]MWB97148.1 aminotransferase class III-fold pyridoxal phosphate-dependent enzyme [Agromyces seonyuensis]
MPIPADASGRTAYELDRAHVFHSWSAQKALDPIVIAGGEGSYLWDADGKRYLDFSSQLVYTNIGHQHPRVVAAIKAQADVLCTIAPAHANDRRSLAAKLIVDVAPEGMNKVFFTNGGAEAVENAIRMARLHTGRTKIMSAYRSYHGATATAIQVTGDPRRWPNEFAPAGTVHFFGPFLYRSVFHATTEQEECERALAHLEQTILFEGPATVAAIVLESVPGTSGIMPPPAGYLAGVRELCDRFGIVMICDEVMSGFGRTGSWFAVDHYGVTPDLITFAKGVNSGYVPMGGVVIHDDIAATFDERAYPGGLTYSGHPLAAAAAVETILAMHDEEVVANAARVGSEVLGPGLRELAERHPSIGDVRGLGVFWALELVADRETKEPLAPYGGASPAVNGVLAAARDAGLLLFNQYHRIHVVPPCNLSDDEAREGLAILDDALSVADAAVLRAEPVLVG